jgi:predicted anti-sigma-YlaC factor YlaD
MRCEQAGEMMSARLDGRLDDIGTNLLAEHMAECAPCQAEWRRLQTLDHLLVSAPMVPAPVSLRVLVLARLSRREQARRAIFGGTALALGTVALALLALAPILLGMLDATGIAPALVSGGPQTIAQLWALLGTTGRTLLVVVEKFAIPLTLMSLFSLAIALALNRLWIGAVRRVHTMH